MVERMGESRQLWKVVVGGSGSWNVDAQPFFFPILYGSFDFIFHFGVLKEDLVELELLEMVIVLLGDVLT